MELSRRIIHAHKTRGLVTVFIYGKYAHGKTSYLLHVSKEVFQKLYNLKDLDAWLMALDHLFFSPVEALMYVETYRSKHDGERVVLLGMDDVVSISLEPVGGDRMLWSSVSGWLLQEQMSLASCSQLQHNYLFPGES